MKTVKADISTLWKQISLEADLKAFELLFHTLNTKLIKFSIFYVKQREVAEEIVADVFVKCWENRTELIHLVNPETYLFVAVKNQSINYQKKFSTIHLVELETTHEVALVNLYDPQKELERKELHFLMDRAIATLPPQACLVFKLIKEDGLKYKEVAEILDISPRTVQTQLFRAIKKLSMLLTSQAASKPYSNMFSVKPVAHLSLVLIFCKIILISL